MNYKKTSKLTLEKFSIHKLNNPSKILGGGDPEKTDKLNNVKSSLKCLIG